MDKILHHQGWWLSHYLQGFNHPRWCRISSINSINLLHILSFALHMESCLPCITNARFGECLRMGTGIVKVPISKPLTKIGDDNDRTRFPTNHHFWGVNSLFSFRRGWYPPNKKSHVTKKTPNFPKQNLINCHFCPLLVVIQKLYSSILNMFPPKKLEKHRGFAAKSYNLPLARLALAVMDLAVFAWSRAMVVTEPWVLELRAPF